MAQIIKNSNLFCTCCGGGHELSYPMKIEEFSSKSKAFEELHKDCKQTYIEPVADQSQSVIKKANWWLQNGFVGLSSKTMWNCLMNNKDFPINIPYDPDDFSRCYKLLEAVPEWKDRLDQLRLLSPTWNALVDNWPKLTEYYENMRIVKKDNGMYDFMDQIIKSSRNL